MHDMHKFKGKFYQENFYIKDNTSEAKNSITKRAKCTIAIVGVPITTHNLRE